MGYTGICALMWLGWWSVWLIVGMMSRVNKVREPFTDRAPHLILLLLGLALAYWTLLFPAFFSLGWPEVYRNMSIAGIVLGLSFACWARAHLGSNWSGLVSLKQDHELIYSGPYRVVRHPIYTGLVFAMVCTAISINTLAAFVGAGLWFAAFAIKANHEEQLLGTAFGDKYLWLCHAVKSRIIPGIY